MLNVTLSYCYAECLMLSVVMTIVVMLSVVVHNVIMLNVVAPTTMLGTNDILHKRRAAFFVVLCVAFLIVCWMPLFWESLLCLDAYYDKQVIFVGFIQLPKKTTTGFTKTRIQPVCRQNLIPLLSIQSSLSKSLFWLWLDNVFDANETL